MKLSDKNKELFLKYSSVVTDVINLVFSVLTYYLTRSFIFSICFYILNSSIIFFFVYDDIEEVIQNLSGNVNVRNFNKYFYRVFPNSLAVILISYLILEIMYKL